MNVARITVLGVAVGAGVIAAMLALNLSQQAEPVVAVDVPTIDAEEVLVAADDIPLGRTLSSGDFSWELWPRAGSTEGLVLRADQPDADQEFSGAIARSPFFTGEPIRVAKLAFADSGYLSAILPSGKRAVATTISADTSAGGFILPNDQVDVIMTRRVESPIDGQEQFITETILTNVRVLAIDDTIEEGDGEPNVIGQTATLELTPQQAEILTAAQQMSERLTLSLRSLADANMANDHDDALHLIGGGARGGGVTIVRNGVPIDVQGVR